MINDLLKKVDLEFARNEYEDTNEDFSIGREYEVYYALSRIFQPTSILEIGVFKGLGSCAMMFGSNRIEHYYGIDAEKYIPESNKLAEEYITKFIDLNSAMNPKLLSMHWVLNNIDTMNESDKVDAIAGVFDWVHIDGAHEESEALVDILQFWPKTRRIMTIHDYEDVHPHVKKDVDQILKDKLLPGLSYSMVVPSGHNFMLFIKEPSAGVKIDE